MTHCERLPMLYKHFYISTNMETLLNIETIEHNTWLRKVVLSLHWLNVSAFVLKVMFTR